ncbi:MAG: TonB-dependent receptor plug domain-containing protein [Bacteroidales bacterium]|jgi:TonB-dependent SusC/RagA subfamily outer membrane receptor|nr:TonB-dependent receptor plug domain-containing protein [Bacteroidales bacterium]
MKKLSLLLFLTGFSLTLSCQELITDTLTLLFNNQLQAFPQEKIHIHTDKPYYISGERIWFRAHLAHSALHTPAVASRYVYVELINPLDSLVLRTKIRQDEGIYAGNIPIPDDIPEGNYSLRAYTSFMRSLDEDYFFLKNIYIGDPQSRLIKIDTQFTFDSDKKITANISFSSVETSSPVVPEIVKAKVNTGKEMEIKTGSDGRSSITFNLPATSKQRVMSLEVVKDKAIYRKYFSIPLPDNDFDVTFFPEGGNLISSVSNRVAFKSLKSNGAPEDVTGTVMDEQGNNIGEFSSDFRGTGSFTLIPEKGKAYRVVCKNEKGISKEFKLPEVHEFGYSLACSWVRNRLYVSVLKPKGISHDPVYILAHTRGIVHYAAQWDLAKEFVLFPKESFPSGVLHVLLLDRQLQPISERLVFVDNDDQAITHYQTDKANYADRSLVQNTITFTDHDENPMMGTFSVSVTDDREVVPDSSFNILTTLLLTSDLRGNIENPGFYFRKNNTSARALDLLMLTQGWRRYDISRMIKGDLVRPTSFLEKGPEISGTVKSVLGGKPAENIKLTMMTISEKHNCFDNAVSDKDGRFYFHNCELPDSVTYMVQAHSESKLKRYEVLIDKETFPKREIPLAPPTESIKNEVFLKYADKAEEKYISENGMRIIHLEEVEIVAQKKPPRKSTYYSQADNTLTEEDLGKFPATNIYSILMRLGVYGSNSTNISIRNQGTPLLIIDDVITDIEMLDYIVVDDVAQVDILKNAGTTAMFGSQGANGAIAIHTKDGNITKAPKKSFHINSIRPLGYQSPVEFYAPKYDTPKEKNNPKPDLRTTIHWQPDVHTDSTGIASFSFYTADAQTTYTVIMEGLTAEGKIIRQESKISRGAK